MVAAIFDMGQSCEFSLAFRFALGEDQDCQTSFVAVHGVLSAASAF